MDFHPRFQTVYGECIYFQHCDQMSLVSLRGLSQIPPTPFNYAETLQDNRVRIYSTPCGNTQSTSKHPSYQLIKKCFPVHSRQTERDSERDCSTSDGLKQQTCVCGGNTALIIAICLRSDVSLRLGIMERQGDTGGIQNVHLSQIYFAIMLYSKFHDISILIVPDSSFCVALYFKLNGNDLNACCSVQRSPGIPVACL